jgi:endonuclease/exonuclease/phosphatase family metal-dependent hydrolase
MGGQKVLRVVEASSVILFLLQAMRVIFSVMFGIIYDQVFAGSPDAWLVVSNLLLLLAFLAPCLARGNSGRFWLGICAMIAAVSRIGLSVNDATIRLWSSLILIAAASLYLALLYKKGWPFLLPGLSIALVLDQFLRLAGQTYDLSLRSQWLAAQVIWAVVLLGLSFWLIRQPLEGEKPAPRLFTGLGIGGLFFLEISLLSLPNGVARWTGEAYAPIALALLAITLAWSVLSLTNRVITRWMQTTLLRLSLAILLSVSLVFAYFNSGWLATLALMVAQLIVLLETTYLLSVRSRSGNSSGSWLAIGMVFYLLLNYFNAFTFTYPYSLPVMRRLGWLVYLVAGLVAGVSTLIQPVERKNSRMRFVKPIWLAGGGLLVWLIALFLLRSPAVNHLSNTGKLRIATYNIHYGYDTYWHFSLDAIAETIAASDADVVTLQEVDTGRLTSYAVDDALYLSRRVRMNVAFLPTVEHLTGIAILYRGEAQELEQRLLSSRQEQTGILHVAIKTGDRPLHAFGIWMGLSNEDTLTQITEAVNFIAGRTPAVFGGDFNAEPDSQVAQIVKEAGFVDPFVALGINPPPLTDPAINPTARIDFVWVRGLTPIYAQVPASLASDHRMVVVEVKP